MNYQVDFSFFYVTYPLLYKKYQPLDILVNTQNFPWYFLKKIHHLKINKEEDRNS